MYVMIPKIFFMYEYMCIYVNTDGEETWPWVWCSRNPVGRYIY
jgi:hypothetical protein